MRSDRCAPKQKMYFNKVKSVIITLIILLFNSGCRPFIPDFDIEKATGYVPIYALSQNKIEITEAIPFANPGKIYQYSTYILIEEVGNGFHIINNSTPTAPVKQGFFQIPLNNNIAIKGNTVYASSGPDLLALAIQPDATIEIKRLHNVFDYKENKPYPPNSGFYFECVDESKGEIIGWELEVIYNPKCYF